MGVQRMSGHRPPRARTAAVALGVAVLVVGCTSGDDTDRNAPEDAEVAGAVLERDEDGEITGPDDEDERDDPREGAPEQLPSPADTDELSQDPDDGGVPDADAPAAADPVAPETSSPSVPAPEPAPALPPAPAPTPAPAPAPTPTPRQAPPPAQPSPPSPPPPSPPPPSPDPRPLPSGPGELGTFFGFGDEGVEIAGVGPVESDPGAGVIVDAVRTTDGRAQCVARVRAAPDRDLRAIGTLTVDLLLEQRDGERRRLPRQILELDVFVAAGDIVTLPASSPTRIDPEQLTEVRCTAEFARA